MLPQNHKSKSFCKKVFRSFEISTEVLNCTSEMLLNNEIRQFLAFQLVVTAVLCPLRCLDPKRFESSKCQPLWLANLACFCTNPFVIGCAVSVLVDFVSLQNTQELFIALKLKKYLHCIVLATPPYLCLCLVQLGRHYTFMWTFSSLGNCCYITWKPTGSYREMLLSATCRKEWRNFLLITECRAKTAHCSKPEILNRASSSVRWDSAGRNGCLYRFFWLVEAGRDSQKRSLL